ncbi:MAG: hypothetical protein OSB62_01670 [Alphaproteobacteria bacterium]|nr:hypothetical protein [Alphaproteobacteria bacterium]
MRYVRLHDGSVYATYEGESNLSKLSKSASQGSNKSTGKQYHPIHDVGALVGYYIPSLSIKPPALSLNQSGVTFDIDNGIWFEDEMLRIAKNPSNEQILFQFLLKNTSRADYYTTVGILDQNKYIFKYVDPHGKEVPKRLARMLERILPQVKIKCFATTQVDDSDDSGPIGVDNLVKLSHNEKLFNPNDFMAHEERSNVKVRKRIINDYMQGLRKNQREALTRLYSGTDHKPFMNTSTDTFAEQMSRLPVDDSSDDSSNPHAKSVGFSIDDL